MIRVLSDHAIALATVVGEQYDGQGIITDFLGKPGVHIVLTNGTIPGNQPQLVTACTEALEHALGHALPVPVAVTHHTADARFQVLLARQEGSARAKPQALFRRNP